MQNLERKKRYIEWRLELLEDMKDGLRKYKELGDITFLEHAKKCGKVSEHLKKKIDRMK